MRFLDLAAAGLIAISSIAVLAASSPQGPDLAARRQIDDAHLRDMLVGFVQRAGILTLTEDGPRDFCHLLGSASNSSVVFSGETGGVACGFPPPGESSANLTLSMGGRPVVLQDWYAAGG